MSWTLFLQIMLLMFWAAILASPWSPRSQRRINREWNEVNKNANARK